jgi:cell division protein FtsB
MASSAATTGAPARRRSNASRTRQQKHKHQRPAIQWHKVGRLALLFTLFVIVLLYIRPVAHWVQQRQTAAHSQADLRDMQRERDRLQARLRELSGPGAIEREARQMGMVRRGERPFVIEQTP